MARVGVGGSEMGGSKVLRVLRLARNSNSLINVFILKSKIELSKKYIFF